MDPAVSKPRVATKKRAPTAIRIRRERIGSLPEQDRSKAYLQRTASWVPSVEIAPTQTCCERAQTRYRVEPHS
jgi:hypothetical protein